MEDCPSPSAGPFQTLNEGVAAERSCAIFRCEILSSIFLQSVDRVVRGTPTTTYVVSSARVTENCSVCRRHGKGRQVRYITCRKQGRETLASALTTYLHTLLPRNRTLHTRPTRLLRRQSRLDGGPARLPAKQSSTNPIQIKCILRAEFAPVVLHEHWPLRGGRLCLQDATDTERANQNPACPRAFSTRAGPTVCSPGGANHSSRCHAPRCSAHVLCRVFPPRTSWPVCGLATTSASLVRGVGSRLPRE